MDDSSDSSEEGRINSEDNHTDEFAVDDEGIIGSAGTLKNRLHYLFRRLVHAISRPGHQLLLWFDGKNNYATGSGNRQHGLLNMKTYKSHLTFQITLDTILPIISRYAVD